jgi:hypothetical protein
MSGINSNANSMFGRNAANSGSSGNRSSGLMSSVNSLTTNNSILYILLGIILLIVLVVVIVILVNRAKKNKANVSVLMGAPADAFDLKDKSFPVKNSDEGLEFSYSVWIYIQDWTRGWKNIFVKGDKTDGASTNSARAPGLWLYPDTNALHARINTFASPNEGCDIKNIPLQKWVHIAYILNNRTVDIYIDGKLERSCVLRGVPKLNDEPVRVCDNGGFFGKISNLVYFRYAMKPDEVYKIYASGPY